MTTDQLTDHELVKTVEGLLFVASEPVTIHHLASVAGCSTGRLESILEQLKEACRERGIRVQQKGNKVQFVSAPELTETIEQFLGLTLTGKLSTPALETLAIVAYRQPITRPEIEAIRGVNSDGVLRTLVSKGLVEEVGRLDSVGQPILFGVTFEFLRYFGLETLDDLPELDLPQLQFPANGTEEAATSAQEENTEDEE